MQYAQQLLTSLLMSLIAENVPLWADPSFRAVADETLALNDLVIWLSGVSTPVPLGPRMAERECMEMCQGAIVKIVSVRARMEWAVEELKARPGRVEEGVRIDEVTGAPKDGDGRWERPEYRRPVQYGFLEVRSKSA